MTANLVDAFRRLDVLDGLPGHRAYERLAALVLSQWFDEPVEHDARVRGSSGASHQIDVLLGADRRGLVECKFYDKKIDLPLVRSFFGQVQDIGADLAAMVTTVGYSRNVSLFAAHHGIDLLVLRSTEDDDLETRIREIHLKIEAVAVRCGGVNVEPIYKADEGKKLGIWTNDQTVYVELAGGLRRSVADRWTEIHGSFPIDTPDGTYPVLDRFDQPAHLVVGEERIGVRAMEWLAVVGRSSTTSVIRGEPLVTLLDEHGSVLEVVSANQLSRPDAERA